MLRSQLLACLAFLSVLAFTSAPLAAQPEATIPSPTMALPDARIAFPVGERCNDMGECQVAWGMWDVQTDALILFGSDYLGDPESMRPSPTGDAIAWSTATSTGWDTALLDLETMMTQVFTTPDIDEGFIKWSPDGEYLAYTMTEDEFQSWHLGVMTGEGEVLSEGVTALNVGGFVWNPDSHSLTVGAYGRERDYLTANLFTYRVSDGSLVPLLARAGGESPLMWSGDGERLLYQTATRPDQFNEYTAYQLNVRTGESTPVFTGDSQERLAPRYVLNDQAVVYWADGEGRYGYEIRLYNLNTGEGVLVMPQQEVRGLDISADGEWMVYNVRETEDGTSATLHGHLCIVALRTVETACFPHLPILSTAAPMWIPSPGLEGG